SGVLDDPDLNPFWEAASARKATLFVHPTFGARDDRLKAYGLVSAVGRVTDTTLAISRLLYSGHLVRYPDVNLVISHGGAALPMVFGRLKRSFATAPAQNTDPAQGFHKLYFDSIVYDAVTLRFVCGMAGADRVLMGTDEPFAIAEQQPVKLIDSCDFNAADRQAILGGTAAKLFCIL
ncbi:MAG TPA: amidohydrolase family protein, partial [Xanthobacteraceae bacterium]